MLIRVLSDLHLEFGKYCPAPCDCDAVILAGDTNLKLTGIRWAMDTFSSIPVIYVFGNHEFYSEKWPRLIDKGRALAAGSNVHILENDSWEIGRWRFFGATLWTDFTASGDIEIASSSAIRDMTDFQRVRHWPSLKCFSPVHARAAHEDTLGRLRAFLTDGDRCRSVVVTHHAPSLRSLPGDWRANPLSGAYASDLEDLIHDMGPAVWIHGHIHAPQDYFIGRTRVLCNPRGYPGETGFRDDYVVDLG